jgi:hypothetical protein
MYFERESSKVTDLSAVRKWVGLTEPQLSYKNVPPWFPVLLTLLFTSHITSGAFILDVRNSSVKSINTRLVI